MSSPCSSFIITLSSLRNRVGLPTINTDFFSGLKEGLKPYPKSFYLNHDQIDLLDFYRLEYQFTDVKEFNDPEAEETESNE